MEKPLSDVLPAAFHFLHKTDSSPTVFHLFPSCRPVAAGAQVRTCEHVGHHSFISINVVAVTEDVGDMDFEVWERPAGGSNKILEGAHATLHGSPGARRSPVFVEIFLQGSIGGRVVWLVPYLVGRPDD